MLFSDDPNKLGFFKACIDKSAGKPRGPYSFSVPLRALPRRKSFAKLFLCRNAQGLCAMAANSTNFGHVARRGIGRAAFQKHAHRSFT
ncbi:MAG: hypothetical protein ACKVKF_26475 [Rhodobacterales bacterium]|uniref:hypothetical protein n=1 Tax=Puniceibacterium antarcticum TaxID=1206336 RepID=UPI00117ADF24|nr:hypothetical protein [Puniceibacterium antarcticum]